MATTGYISRSNGPYNELKEACDQDDQWCIASRQSCVAGRRREHKSDAKELYKGAVSVMAVDPTTVEAIEGFEWSS